MKIALYRANTREIVLWLFRRRRRYRITGNSMHPVLVPGNQVLVDESAYRKATPQLGDIVMARHPFQAGLRIVKRVSGITEDGRFFLEGFNPLESTDSHSFGPVAAQCILGRITCYLGV